MNVEPAGEPIIGDAFGRALADHLEHGSAAREHFVERDDGYLQSFDTAIYFTSKSVSGETEVLVDRAGARVLDVAAEPDATHCPSRIPGGKL